MGSNIWFIIRCLGVGFPQSRALDPILFDIYVNYIPFHCWSNMNMQICAQEKGVSTQRFKPSVTQHNL